MFLGPGRLLCVLVPVNIPVAKKTASFEMEYGFPYLYAGWILDELWLHHWDLTLSSTYCTVRHGAFAEVFSKTSFVELFLAWWYSIGGAMEDLVRLTGEAGGDGFET